jgi:hypothetical protein
MLEGQKHCHEIQWNHCDTSIQYQLKEVTKATTELYKGIIKITIWRCCVQNVNIALYCIIIAFYLSVS